MSAASLLRTASVLCLLFAAGHTLGGNESWSPPGETEVLQAMRSFRFEAGGASRSYLDFYRGFGYTISVQLGLQAVLLWQLGRIEPRRTRPLIASFVLACLASALVSWRLIMAGPVAFQVAIVACLGAAWLRARPGSEARAPVCRT